MPDPFDPIDAVLARKLGEIEPPADLRERLRALHPSPVATAESRTALRWAQGILGVAAAFALALVIVTFWPSSHEPLTAATTELSSFLTKGFPLTMKTSDVNAVRAWLERQNPARTVALPGALAARPPLGCRELLWRNHRGSLACFSLGDGRAAHLAMFPASTFTDAPGATPELAAAGAWTRAAWTADGMTYLLFVPEGVDPAKFWVSTFRVSRLLADYLPFRFCVDG